MTPHVSNSVVIISQIMIFMYTATVSNFVDCGFVASVVQWSRVPVYRSRGPGSIPDATRFSEK
jgi:hypothetical protein